MKFSHRSWILSLQLMLLLDFEAMGRVYSNFLVIRDTTFICKDGKLQFRKVELSDDDKTALLESKGGHMLSPYMARDQRSAEQNFINPLSLHSIEPDERDTPHSNEKRDSSYSSKILIDRKRLRHKATVLRYLNEIVEKRSQELTEDIMDVLEASQSEEIHQKPTRRRISRRGRRKRHVKTSPRRVTTTPSTPHNLLNATSSRIPYVLPQQLGLQSSFSSTASGTKTDIEYCDPRGSKTPDGEYLHMCTTCAATTSLPENYFPSVINEAICQPEDSSCFIVEQIPQGECQQRRLTMDILRRKDGYCTLALKDDEVVIVDEWELTDLQRNVGCECAMHKDSAFATFV